MVKTKSFFIVLGICCTTILAAQQYTYGYLVEFTNKANSIYSTERPLEYLSQRAINRRSKQNIEITEQDFPVNKTYIDSILKFNATWHVTSRWLNSAVFYTNNNSFISEAKKCLFVKDVTLVYKGSVLKSVNIQNKWDAINEGEKYGSSYNQIAMCNAQHLHDKGFKGNGIHIAVLDAGFWRANEFAGFDSLFKNNRILSHWDFVSHNNNVFDDNWHGMSVLSTMGANYPDSIIGTAPEASYHLFRTENVSNEFPIEEENWIAAAETADSAGADIITTSLGYNVFDDSSMNYTYSAMDGKTTRCSRGAELAFSKGMVLINSAGNEGNKAWYYITTPSDAENVLCVGAVNSDRTITNFSSRGPSFDGRVKPDVMAKGGGTTIITSSGLVGTGNGTSFSAPVMAGMVACLWQALPSYSNTQLLHLIRSYGDRFSNPTDEYGYGIPDFSASIYLIDSFINSNSISTEIVKVYPNPFTNYFKFDIYIQKGKEIDIVLFNGMGEKVYSVKKLINSASINLVEINNLPKLAVGIYFLAVYTEDGMVSKKIVKN